MSLLVHGTAHWSKAFQEASFPSLLEELGHTYHWAVLLECKLALGACNSTYHSGTVQYSLAACLKRVERDRINPL